MRVSKSTQTTPVTGDKGEKAGDPKKATEVPSFDTDAFVRSQRDPAKDTGNGTFYGTSYRSSGRR